MEIKLHLLLVALKTLMLKIPPIIVKNMNQILCVFSTIEKKT